MADFRIGDYDYTIIDANNNYVQVETYDKTKSSYGALSSKIEYEGEEFTVTSMSRCFYNCTSFDQSITIPESVTDMSNCFAWCDSFNHSVVIPESVTNMSGCFGRCISFNQLIIIPESVTNVSICFGHCYSLNQYIICFNKPSVWTDIFQGTTKEINIIAIGDDNYSTWQNLATNNIHIPDNFKFEYGDYKYIGVDSGNQNHIRVQVIDKTKVEYGEILSTYINNRKVTNMSSCFANCVSLVNAPIIPSSVTNMYDCFYKCTSLVNAPVIPNGVTFMYGCFMGCTSLVTAPVIPSNVTDMESCFEGCTSLRGDVYIYAGSFSSHSSYSRCFYDTSHTICLHAMNNNTEECDALASTANNNNVYVNVKPETALNFNNTQVNYLNQNSEFIALSMQTNANLIQCRIPKLSGGEASIITTNLNDALIDLYKRKVGGA